jgi:hypothetical protein
MATKSKAVSMVSYDVIENNKLVHVSRPLIKVTDELLLATANSANQLSEALTGALMLGEPVPYKNGGDFVKALNDNREKGAKRIIIGDVKSAYDMLQAMEKVRKLSDKPLAPQWHEHTQAKIKEREIIAKLNAELKTKGENPKALPRITPPSVNGLLAMLDVKEETPAIDKIVKYLTSASNLVQEQKGKAWSDVNDRLSALMVAIDKLS